MELLSQSKKKYLYLIKNILIFALGNFGTKVITILLLPLISYYIIPSDYGILDVINTASTILGIVVGLGLYDAVFRWNMEDKENKKYIEISLLASGGAFFLFTLIYIAIMIFFNLPTIYYVVIPFTLISIVVNNFKQYIRALDKVFLYVLSEFVFVILYGIFIIVFLPLMNLGMLGYILAGLIAGFLRLGFLIIYTKEIRKIRYSGIDFSILKEMLSYSIPITIGGLFWSVISFSNRFFIMYFLGNYYNGIFAMAYKIPNIIVMLNSIFFMAWQMSSIKEKDKNFAEYFKKLFHFFSTVQIGISILILGGTNFIFRYVINIEYYDSVPLIPPLMLSVLFNTFLNYYAVVIIINKKTLHNLLMAIPTAFVSIASNFILIIYFDLAGVAISAIITMLFYWVIMIFYAEKTLAPKVNYNTLVVNLAFYLIATVIFYVINEFIYEIICILILLIFYTLINRKTIYSLYLFSNKTMMPLIKKKYLENHKINFP